MKCRKALSLILALVMVLTLMPLTALAAENDGEGLPNFTNKSGSSGTYDSSSGTFETTGSAKWTNVNIFAADNLEWSTGTVELTFVDNGVGGAYSDFGIVLHYDGSSQNASANFLYIGTTSSGWFWQYRSGGGGEYLGSKYTLIDPAQLGEETTLRVDYDGTAVTVYVNDILIPSASFDVTGGNGHYNLSTCMSSLTGTSVGLGSVGSVGSSTSNVTVKSLKLYDEVQPAPEQPVEPEREQLADNTFTGTTHGQPFIVASKDYTQSSIGSRHYRIPALVTLPNGWLVAAADIRWQSWADNPANMDTMVSISKDNGLTWEYSAVNYLGDYDNNTASANSTSFIDPALLVTGSGNIWLACDLTPNMVTGGRDSSLGSASGYDEQDRLLVASVTAGQCPTTEGSYGYRLDLNGSGVTAHDAWNNERTVYPITNADTDEGTDMYADAFFYLYEADESGDIVPVMCNQLGNSVYKTQNNLLYQQSSWRLYPTFYMCLRKGTVTATGIDWDDPIYPNIRYSSNNRYFLGICPGRGTVVNLEDGTERIMFQVYDNHTGQEHSSVFYSDDGGDTWHRGQRATDIGTSVKNSESQIVLLPDGKTLRMYSRAGGDYIPYAESSDYGDTWDAYTQDKDLYTRNNNNQGCMVSFINVAGQLTDADGNVYENLICASYPYGRTINGNRQQRNLGIIRIGSMGDDGTVTWLNKPTSSTDHQNLVRYDMRYLYSCLTQEKDAAGTPTGTLALLYETDDYNTVGNNYTAEIQFDSFQITDLLDDTWTWSLGEVEPAVPEAPTADEAAVLIGSINVTDTGSSNHGEADFPVEAAMVTVNGGPNLTDDGSYIVDVTVDLSGLVSWYDETYGNGEHHTLDSASTLSLKLIYADEAWQLTDGTDLTVQVKCNPAAPPSPPSPPATTTPSTPDEELGDNDTPLSPDPDGGKADPDGDAPSSPAPDDNIQIPDGDTPLDSTPKTSDNSVSIAILWTIFTISAVGFVWTTVGMKKSGKHSK